MLSRALLCLLHALCLLQMKAAAGTLDGIIDTVSAKHDIASYMALLIPANGK